MTPQDEMKTQTARESDLASAAALYLELGQPDLTPEQEQDLRQWLSDCSDRCASFNAVDRAWQEIGALEEYDLVQTVLADPAIAKAQNGFLSRPPAGLWGGMAAAVLALAVIGFLQLASWSGPQTQTYRTSIGELQEILLADGSTVFLNTDSEINVEFDNNRRLVVMASGEALFDVAKDADRPFDVAAGDIIATALGTKYRVRNDDTHYLVTVIEGNVSVKGSTPSTGDADDWRHTLESGEELTVSQSQNGPDVNSINPDEVALWSRGRLQFSDERLANVVAELNRYTTRKITIADRNLADIPISANFRISDSDYFAQTLALVVPVRIESTSDGSVVLRDKRSPDE